MTRPTFDPDDCKMPDDLVQELRERGSFWLEDIGAAYRAGIQAGYAIGKAEWPTPISDRRPTLADADEWNKVQFVGELGIWGETDWHYVAERGWHWLHTPCWRPKPPPLKELALAAMSRASFSSLSDYELIRRALEAQP